MLSLSLFSVEASLFSHNNGFLYFDDSHASHLASHLGARSGSKIRTILITNQVSISDFFSTSLISSTVAGSRSHHKGTNSLFSSNSIRHPSAVAFLHSVNLASGSSARAGILQSAGRSYLDQPASGGFASHQQRCRFEQSRRRRICCLSRLRGGSFALDHKIAGVRLGFDSI
nr:hypothetical protein CFP56_23530 [Quercus suber]